MEQEQINFEFEPKKVIKGYPELHWMGKRPYKSTQYYPAQLKETYGKPDENGWMNKIFWGDNLQVMSHLLKDYRGQIDLIYIDPPFDSKADYKKKIFLKKQSITNDTSAFEEKQYGDLWNNDEYLQFIYERLLLLRELLSSHGTIYFHCDWHRCHQLRCLMDEVFGPSNFLNEVIWQYFMGGKGSAEFAKKHDNILVYAKNKGQHKFNKFNIKRYYDFVPSLKDESSNGQSGKDEIGYWGMVGCPDVWQIKGVFNMGAEYTGYPTQKPEELMERILKASTDENDLVLDCFMGSGSILTQSQKMNRRFIGADINLGAVQTTTERLLNIIQDKNLTNNYTGFEVYNVNNYDMFRNPVEAKDLIIEALEIQKFDSSVIYDGEKDGRMVYIMPVNRIATKSDLEALKSNLPYKIWDKRKEENPTAAVEKITLVCMGHESDLKATLQQDLANYKVDIEIIDLLRDKSKFTFKRDAEADIKIKDGKLIIKNFYPMNLMQKLSMQKEEVENWKQLVDSVMIDFNYNGQVLKPQIIDIPNKNALVKGEYEIPKDAKKIRVKITDLLSESLEVEVK